MSKAGEIYYDIKIRENGYKSQMNKIDKDMDNFAKKGQKASDNIDKINKKNINVKGLDSSIVKVEQFGNMLEKSGQKLTKAGTAMTVGFTAPIVAGMVKSTKAYLDFDNEVTEVNSLLRESGESAKEFGDRYTQVFDYAQKASVKYGVASEQTMLGMKEMVKKGYDINQTMASMPAIFNAARASGDDFETVMSVTTSTLEQFGMISKDTNKQMEYTNKVADVLTYVADKTAAGFSDMGTAMNYVGPISHSLGYSLTDTAAAVGLLSNRGIEGQKAGTGLRGMLTSLLKPSKSAAEAMASVGLTIEDNNGNMKTLPTLLDDINDKTKKMTKTQKNSFLTMIFGREPLSAVNTLLEAGGDSLRKYSKGADEANGYTKQVADNMRKASKFGVDQFKASLEVLEQNVGQKLMPALTPIIEWANKMIDKFNDLSGAQQQSIIKWAGILAATGPVLMIGGKLVSMTGGLIKGFAGLGKILGLGSKLAPLAAGFGATTTAVEGTSLAAAGLAGSFGALPAVIGLAGAALIGVGIYALDKHISKIEESKERIKTWGYDIGAEADKSMGKFNEFASEGKLALDTFATGATDDSKRVVTAFKNMADEIKKNTDDALNGFKASYEKFSPAVQAILDNSMKDSEKRANERKANVNAQYKEIEDIYKAAAEKHRNLTSEESKTVNNIYKAMQIEQVESLGLNESKKKQIIKAMNGEVESLNQDALVEQSDYLNKITKKTIDSTSKQKKELKKAYDDGLIDKKSYNDSINQMDRERDSTVRSSVTAWIKTQEQLYDKLGVSSDVAQKNIKHALDEMGLSYDEFTRNVQEAAGGVSDASKLIGDGASKADLAWSDLVLDPKTGEVKTNLNQVVLDAAKSNEGWNNLKFIMKEAKLTTDAKKTIATATIESGRWDKMTFNEKKLIVSYEDSIHVANALSDLGVWDKLKPEQKSMIANADTSLALQKALQDMGVWDKLPPSMKTLVVDNSDVLKKLNSSKGMIVDYNGTKVDLKSLLATNTDVKTKIEQGKNVIVEYNGQKINLKNLYANNRDLLSKVQEGKNNIYSYNGTKVSKKTFTALTNADTVRDLLNNMIADWGKIPQRQQKVLEIAYKTNGKAPSGVQGLATGTNNHSGGPALVNDAKGSNYEEMITTPDGNRFIPKGRNVLLDLPRGTEVLRGDKTAKALRNVPRYAKGTSKQTAYAKNVNNKIANVQTDYKTGAINAQGYINKLKQINKQYTLNEAQTRKIRTNIAAANKEISTQKTKLNQAVKSSTQKYYDNVKKANDEAKASISEAKKTYNDALKANQESAYSQISLFDRAKTDKYAGSDLLANLKTQTQQQDEFIALINKLKKRKVNDGLVNELREQGLSATGQISAIANMSDKELQAYQAEWSKKHKNANAIGLDGSISEKATMDKAILAANKKATTDIASAKNTWLKELGDAKQFKTAGSILGTQTVAGIITGFKNMNGPLQKESSNIAKTIENTIKKELDIHSPSRKMENEVGFQVIAGVGVGMRKNANIISIEAARMSKNLTNSIPRIDVPVTPNTQAINAYQSDSNKLVSNQKNIVANAQPIQVNLVLPDDSSTPVASWLINDIDTLLNAKTIISRVKAGG
ncbi:phage tail tape measure protein [Listeria monocytogenes serotype 4b]|uniref:phage tail tape measure protein n=1 Tax=Listeria monocytogenes TaxID=1639 RepID=UPI000D730394|nr:phage tail tape measure protein [Listeria monocytogenes]MCZ97082.1 phage tail tape measure protein [Listeria monocytogenes serotype 4b]EFQ6786115.1 phage tail tape measure protein [Listeria monocytogenes]EGP4670450.1 phage tail tape measure protein [Listeria monocytogenes]MCZ99052.1 phage tail tape measure protein [Listeria monocytogenes]MDA40983.1 phage tail tape measure protein [Listeria monocytogenes serotype 4b]